MKWIKRLSIGMLIAFFMLWLIVGLTTNHTTVQELKNLFFENEGDFRRTAEVLTEVLSKHDAGISINTRNFYADRTDDRLVVEKIGSLYFVSVDEHFTQEEYFKMYDAVADLISSERLWGISGSGEKVTFCVSLHNGIESDIIYKADGTPPAVLQTVKEQGEICDRWYSIITHD